MIKQFMMTALITVLATSAFAGDQSLCESNPDCPMCTGGAEWDSAQPTAVNETAEDLVQFGLESMAQKLGQSPGEPSCNQLRTEIQCSFTTAASQLCEMRIRTLDSSYGFDVLCHLPRSKRVRRMSFRKSRRFEN